MTSTCAGRSRRAAPTGRAPGARGVRWTSHPRATGGMRTPSRAAPPKGRDSALLYIIAPIVGGVLAAFLYDRFISQAEAPQ